MAAITCCALLQRSDFLRDAKQFISDDWQSRAGSVSPNESKIPGSILGENTNAFGVVTGIRHKNLPIKYVMLRAVTTPCERSSNAKQLYSIQPSPITTVPTGDDSKTCRQWG